MNFAEERRRHEETWQLLPWLVNGRLSQSEREQVEQHLRGCAECEREFASQHRLCEALGEPDRVVYAPGPSLRKLLERIDGGTARKPLPVERAGSAVRPAATLQSVSLWRPPGLAWAASFLVLFGMTGLIATAYRWNAPAYHTHTDSTPGTPDVLHIALDRSLTIADVDEMLRRNGARMVEGPGETGILGIAPIGVVSGRTAPAEAVRRMHALATQLRADSRVLWVQPVSGEDEAGLQRPPAPQEH